MLRCTRFTAIKPTRLSKRFTLVGATLVKEGGGDLTEGIAERLTVASLAAFAALLPTLKPNQALAYGVNGRDTARVVTAAALTAAAALTTEPVIARTRDFFAWPSDAGILMLDYDPAPDGPALDREALRAALAAACPAIADAPAIWRPSASSCIFTRDGAELRGIAGQRLYLPVLEASDIPRAGQVLFDRLWLAGFGRYEISKSGALLARTVMDATVFQPERLDFCGGAAVGKELVQRLPEPVLFNGDAPYLDTRAALPDLTAEERARLTELREALAEPLTKERARIREAWIVERVGERVEKLPDHERAQARPELERVYRQAAVGGRLEPDFELTVVAKGSKARRPITVRELLKDRARYHEATTLDPLEPGYPDGQARLVGWLNLRARPPYLQSWAHGGVRYELGAEEAPASAPMDDGYWESLMRDAEYSRVGVASNPSYPSYQSYPINLNINYSVIDKFQSVISVMLPLLEDADDKGKPVLIESFAAARLVDCLKNRFAFCRKTLRWYAFVATHWEGLTAPIVDEVVTQLLYAGAPHGFKASTLAAILSLLTKGQLPLPATAAADTRLIPFTNGLLDPVTRILTPITPDNALTWSLPYAYNPTASCPTIRRWLRAAVESEDGENGDNPDDMVDFLRAWLAGLLTGRADLQCFLHLLGPGGTGKGTFIRMAEALVGQHNATVTDLRNLETNRFETAALYGKRLAAITDSSRYGGGVDVLKALTGQDPLRLEVKHRQQGATFTFGGMVLLAGNEPLQFNDYTGAIERRRLTVAFDRRVSAAERDAWDRQGGEAVVLHREIPGLVNWLLELSRSDVSRIIKNQPRQMTRLNREVMQHSNPIADWLLQCVIPDPNCALLMGGYQDLTINTRTSESETESRKVIEQADSCAYPNYRAWCLRYHRAPVSTRRFSPLVIDIARTLGVSVYRSKNMHGAYIKGLRLRREGETGLDAWQRHDGSIPDMTGHDGSSVEKSTSKLNSYDGYAGNDGKPSPTFLYRAKEEAETSSPPVADSSLAGRILSALTGSHAGFSTEELCRQCGNGRGASPAMIELVLMRLVKEGDVSKANGRWISVRDSAESMRGEVAS